MATTSNTQRILEMFKNLELVIREAKHSGYKDWESDMEVIRMSEPVFTNLASKIDLDNLDIDAHNRISECFLDLLDFYYDRRSEVDSTTYTYRVLNSLYDIVHTTYFGY